METVRGGGLVDLFTENQMCYKSANVANVADLANVLQIGIGRIVIEILIVIVLNFNDAMYQEIEIILIWSKILKCIVNIARIANAVTITIYSRVTM